MIMIKNTQILIKYEEFKMSQTRFKSIHATEILVVNRTPLVNTRVLLNPF